MNTNLPATASNEETGTTPLEKLPKLNFPPKPVLATTVPPPPAAPLPSATPSSPSSSKLEVEAPSVITKPVSPAMPLAMEQSQKTVTMKASSKDKKLPTLSLPLALIAFLAALLGLFVQLFSFLHLF